MSVDVEWDRKKLWHDAVVGDQGGQARVNLYETLKLEIKSSISEQFMTYFYLISIL